MNKRRMESLAKFIEKLPQEHFDMSDWIVTDGTGVFCKKDILNSCGTSCCIAGWQGIKAGFCLDSDGDLLNKKTKEFVRHASYWASDYLDLTHDQSYTLFRKHTWPLQFRDRKDSPQLAAERIRYMIETGL